MDIFVGDVVKYNKFVFRKSSESCVRIMKKEAFGAIDGQDIFLFHLENENGVRVKVSNFGALLVSVEVPDQAGNYVDVALGYDTLAEYRVNTSFFGATVGPNANRIANARYTLEGVTYCLDANNGANNLHSHMELGLHKRIWAYREGENSVELTTHLQDGEMGFGGNKQFSVTYTLEADNSLVITYYAESDKNTLINLTNHSYFNLDGQGAGTILNHKMQIFASNYIPVGADLIPTGEIQSVENTPMDFRGKKSIGKDVHSDFSQIKIAGGFDQCFCVDGCDGGLRKVASVTNSDETRTMEVYTDLPGIQFYAGNQMTPEQAKAGAQYDRYSGFALETQYYPDSLNNPRFPSAVFGPERPYRSTTVYKFL